VEIVDKEGDRIHADALKEASPNLQTRLFEHSDQLVGEIIESTNLKILELEMTEKHSRKKNSTDYRVRWEESLYVAGRIYDYHPPSSVYGINPRTENPLFDFWRSTSQRSKIEN